MKRVLITGAKSFIGCAFDEYIKQNYRDEYIIDTIDMVDGSWREKDFSKYDVIFHVAGIAHSDSRKISAEEERRYYAVNTELSIETARKAKENGAKQFIFMSSAIVYGNSAPLGKDKLITQNTPVSPANCYGDSKVQAEKGIRLLDDKEFKVVILRPPMIYGKECKGNYLMLSKLAQKVWIFPYIENRRSMLYIDSLCQFVHYMIKNEERGVFFPQNAEYSNTSRLISMIASAHGKNVKLVKGFGTILKYLGKVMGVVNKAFGNLAYDMDISKYKEEYRVASLEESIKRTEQ